MTDFLDDENAEEDEESVLERHERRITRCNSCRARIIFLATSTGKKMPVDADSVDPEELIFEPKKHESHFATCPNADSHRRPRQ